MSGNIQTGGAAAIGASATVVGNVAAVSAITLGAGASVGSQATLGSSAAAAIDAMVLDRAAQIAAARSALSNMGAGTVLAASIATNQTLTSGVYSSAAALTTAAGITLTLDGQGLDGQYWIFNIADALVTGASNSIKLINAGPNSGVIWNIGSYATFGADSTLLGTILANSYISVGANVNIADAGSSRGGLFSEAGYIVTGDTVTLGSGSLTAGGARASTTFTGVISGSGGVKQAGSGIFTLSGLNTYTGATTISAGTLQLGIDSSIPSTSAVSVASGATLDLGGFNQTVGSLAGAGTSATRHQGRGPRDQRRTPPARSDRRGAHREAAKAERGIPAQTRHTAQ